MTLESAEQAQAVVDKFDSTVSLILYISVFNFPILSLI